MLTKKWFSGPALIALLLSVAVVQSYPESSERKGPPVGPAGQGKPRPGVPAKWSGVTLRKLKVLTEQDGVTTVEITATRPVTPTMTTLTSPDRLVLDFPNTLSASQQNVVAVNDGGVKSVRIGVQLSDPPMTRLVVDLLQPRTSELVAIGDTTVLTLRSVGDEQEKREIGSVVEAAAISDPPFPQSGVDSSPPFLAGVTFKPKESQDHGGQLPANSQESAVLPQAQDSSKSSTATEGSPTIPSSGQEVGKQTPAADGPATSDNGNPGHQQPVNEVLSATVQGTEPATPANSSSGTVPSPDVGGDAKALPTKLPLPNTNTGYPGVQEPAEPPKQTKDSGGNSSATGGSGTAARSGQEGGLQMPAVRPPTPNNEKPESQQTVNQVLPATGQGAGSAASSNGSNGTVSSPAAADETKAVSTPPPLSNTTASPGVQETPDPPTQSDGNADTQWQLGLGSLNGIGVPQDERKAAEWFKTAANQGDIRAQSALSDLYFNGRGVPRDYVRAYTWASIAAGSRGTDNDRLKAIRSRMTAVQIDDAHRRISVWWERHKLKGEAPASTDLVQEPIHASTLGGGSGSEPANPVNAKDTKTITSQNAPAPPPQAAPQAQPQEQQTATRGNQSTQTETPTASSEQIAAPAIQQPANMPAQPNDEPELAKPSTPDRKITFSQNDPVPPSQPLPQPQEHEQQQATPGNQFIQTDTPRATSEQNAAATVQLPTNAPAHPKDKPELVKPLTSPSLNAPVTPPQIAPQAQQLEQQQATPGSQSSQTHTPKATSEQNAAATAQLPTNVPAQPNDKPELAKPLTSPSQNAPVIPPQAQQLEQHQGTPGSQSGQANTPTATGGQNAAATIQQSTNALAQPSVEPGPAKPSTLSGGPVSAVANASLAQPMVAPPLNAADVAGTVDRAKQQPSPDEYVIGEQDVLTITIWRERELSGSVVVRPDGKITLPLVDDIQVVGLTPAQLRAVLVEKLKPFVTIPQVTVAVSQINSRKVYLIGEVGRTGTFPINSATTVLQILSQAGGVKDFAKRKDIYVLRNEQGKQVRHRFNYDEVIRGKNSEQNILLQPADTIVVP